MSEADAIGISLATFQDIEGIAGSFFLASGGRLVARHLPAMFDDEILKQVGMRLVRLRDTFAVAGDEVDLCTMRFSDYKLYTKVIPKGMLCILATAEVNVPALRMAANLVARRILSEPLAEAELAAGNPPANPRTPGAPLPAVAAQPGSTFSVRMYRGVRVDD
jgi:hypothetical protein